MSKTHIDHINRDAQFNEAGRDMLQAGQNLFTGDNITVVIGEQDKKTNKATKEIPRLLPYLSDRVDQELALGTAIKSHCNLTQPFICVIHGEGKQCSDMFVERIFHRSLAQILPVQASKEIKRFDLSSDRFSNYQEFHTKLDASISLEVTQEFFASQGKVARILADAKTPILLCITFSSQDCLGNKGVQVIDFFLQYWRQWKADQNQSNLLLVCFCFDYMPVKTSFWQQWRNKDALNAQLRDYFAKLNFAQFDLQGVVLPELGKIEQRQVEDWARIHHRGIYEKLRPEIEELFRQNNHQPFAMQPLAKQLQKMLENFA